MLQKFSKDCCITEVNSSIFSIDLLCSELDLKSNTEIDLTSTDSLITELKSDENSKEAGSEEFHENFGTDLVSNMIIRAQEKPV